MVANSTLAVIPDYEPQNLNVDLVAEDLIEGYRKLSQTKWNSLPSKSMQMPYFEANVWILRTHQNNRDYNKQLLW